MLHSVLDFSPTATKVIENVRALGPTLRDRATAAERAGRVSDETIADLDAAGVFEIGGPAEFGGYELSIAEQLEVITEVAKWDGSCAWVAWVGVSSHWFAWRSGKTVVEEVYGEPWVGPRVAGSAHLPATKGRARRVEGGWIISGGPWTFASNGLWARWTNIGCILEGDDERCMMGVQLRNDQLRSLDDWNVAGMCGSGSVSVALVEDEVFVPEHRCVPFANVLEGKYEHGLNGSVWQAPTVGSSFSTMTGMSIGIAQGALQRFLERAEGKPVRGTTYKNQLEAPLTHLMLADVHTKIRTATLIARANATETDHLGKQAAAGNPADPATLQAFGSRIILETAYAAKLCAEAVELLQRNSGSTAIQLSEPIQRAWRDARVVTLHGALNLEAASENYGRLMAGSLPHQGVPDRFAPVAVRTAA